ncbi:MAG: flagellar hook-length control protein FliK [Gammaproteobacteria bacterium]|nr:flagellar hook-length control protein FliK [Gammaproteobacteria bacterium]
MKQYERSETPDEAVEPEARDPALELLGNGLPIPVATPVILPTELTGNTPAVTFSMPAAIMLPVTVEAEADIRLEEFAVGLGIDRELARLLLRETAAQPVAIPVDTTTPLPSSSIATAPAISPPLTLPASVPAPPSVSVSAPTSILPSVSAPPSLSLREVQPQSAHPTYQLEDEPRTELPAISPPLTLPASIPALPSVSVSAPLVVPGIAAPALRDEDVLRWRAFIHRSSSGLREPAQEVTVQAARGETFDPLTAAPRRGLSEIDFAAATASLRGFALERRQILTSTVTPVSSTALTAILPGDSPVNPAVLPAATSAPPNVPVTTLADPLTTPLRVPDPALQHELRAEQFAEQVGRRMLQQIREDRWTVNLQLDPQRLGPMEIELQLEGNQVTAQVGVANAEVRHLLESALPKLRESLDSAGLNLANWSFAQSGAREFREFAQQSAAAAAKATSKAAELASEDEAPRRVTEESASRVVDVYV